MIFDLLMFWRNAEGYHIRVSLFSTKLFLIDLIKCLLLVRSIERGFKGKCEHQGNKKATDVSMRIESLFDFKSILIKNHFRLIIQSFFQRMNSTRQRMLLNWIYRSENCWHMYPFSIVNNKILKGHSIIFCWFSAGYLERIIKQLWIITTRAVLKERQGKGNEDIFVLLKVGWARFPIKFIISRLVQCRTVTRLFRLVYTVWIAIKKASR